MAASSRYIHVSLHPQGDVMRFPCFGDRISLQSIKSVFQQATGLKHQRNSIWQVVPIEDNQFILPVGVDTFFAITGSIGQARQIVTGALASRIASVMRPTVQVPQTSSLPSLPSTIRPVAKKLRGDSRQKFTTRSYKIVYLKETELPIQYSKKLVFFEGMVDICTTDDELSIKHKLQNILVHGGVKFDDIKILTYTSKNLSLPHCLPDFQWNGSNIKALVGQGKLYIMIVGYKETVEELDSSDDSLPDIGLMGSRDGASGVRDDLPVEGDEPLTHHSSSLEPLEKEDTVSTGGTSDGNTEGAPGGNIEGLSDGTTGTPTVTFHPRHCRRRPEEDHSASGCNSLIEIYDSEDEELARGIEASLEDSHLARNDQNATSLEQALKDYQAKAVDNDVRSDVIVSRMKVLDSAFRGLSRKTFSLRGRLYIKFSGEMGEDYGGPRREFFRLAVKALMDSSLFEGQYGQKLFSHDITSLDEGKYRLAGRMVALSVAQGGPGLHSLSQALYSLMAGIEPDLSSAQFPEEVQNLVSQIEVANDDMKRDRFLAEHMDWFIEKGFNNVYRMVKDNKTHLIYMVKKHYIFYRNFGIHQGVK